MANFITGSSPQSPREFFQPPVPQAQPAVCQDDSDDWWSGVQQCAATVAIAATLAITGLSTAQAAQVAAYPEEIPANTLYGPPEEDFWQNSITQPSTWRSLFFSSSASIPPPPPVEDEDYWQNPVVPLPLTFGPLYLPDPEELSAGKLSGQPDEDFWTNAVAPVPLTFGPLYLPDPEEIPSGKLFGQPDEDFWINAVAPIPAYLPPLQAFAADDIFTSIQDEDFWLPPLPWPPATAKPFTDDDVISATAFTPDEDFWQSNIRQPAQWASLFFSSSASIPPPPPVEDEDYWQNPVVPLPLTFGPLYLPDPEELSAGKLSGQPDEDFWTNAVAPVPLTFGPLYLPDPEEIPSGKLFGQPDEDFWQNPVAPVFSYPFKVFIDEDLIVPVPVTYLDEDFWNNPVAPVPLTFGKLYLPDPEEISATTLHGEPDEDFWQNAVPPVPGSNYQRLPYGSLLDPEELPATALHGEPDEDFWINPVPPISSYPVPLYYTADDIISPPPLAVTGDEDFWTNPVAPVGSYPVPIYSIYDDIISSSPTSINTDEDFWQNPVLPIPASNFIQLPYLPDPEEIPAGSLVGPLPFFLDEDLWQYRIKGSSLWTTALFGSSNTVLAAASTIKVDEAYWQNPVPPVLATFGRIYLPDPDVIPGTLVGPTLGQPDEDFWINPVAPVPATNWQKLPYLPDPEEIPAGSLIGPAAVVSEDDSVPGSFVPPDPLWQILFFLDDGSFVPQFNMEEDYWQNDVVPAPIVAYPVPVVFAADDIIVEPPTTINTDEDFWTNPVAPVPLLFGKLYLPDPEEIPAGNLVGPPFVGEPDEDFWQNRVAPVPATNFIKLPYLPDPEEIPAARLFGEFDEDFWQNPVVPIIGANWQRLPYGSLLDPEEITTTLFGQLDEDFWINPVAPVFANNFIELPYLSDPESLPGKLSGQPDEDFWQNPVAPVFSYPLPVVFALEDDLLSFGTDEDFWINPVPPVQYLPPVMAIVDDEIIPTPPPIPDEDFWTNPVAPIGRYPVPIYFIADDTVEIQVLPPDEDFWTNPVAPIPYTLRPLYMPDPDPEELPTVFPTSVIGTGVVNPLSGIGQIHSTVTASQTWTPSEPNAFLFNPAVGSNWIPSEQNAFIFNPVLNSVYGLIIGPDNPGSPAGPGFQGFVASQLDSALGPDQFAEVTVAKYLPFPLGPGGNTIGPCVRMSIDPVTGLVSGYSFEISYDSFGLLLSYNTGVTPGQGFGAGQENVRGFLVPEPFGHVVNVGDVIRIEAVGNQITAKINGVVVLGPVIDNRIATGQPGLCGYPEISDITNATQVSNFRCGALPSGPVLIPSLISIGNLPSPTRGSIYGKTLGPLPGYKGECAAVLNAGFGPDQFAEATVTSRGTPGLSTGNFSISVAVRMTIDPITGLISCYFLGFSYDGQWALSWEVGISPNEFFAVNTDFQRADLVPRNTNGGPVVGDVIRIEAVGNVITGKLNGVVVFGPVVDNKLPTGQPGVEAYPEDMILADALQIAKFRAGELPSGRIVVPDLSNIGGTNITSILVPLAVDTFHRPNQNPVNTNWKSVGLAGFVLGQVLNNQYVGQNGAATGMLYDGGLNWTANQYSQATLRTLNLGKGYAGLFVRGTPSTDGVTFNKYQFLIDGISNNQGIGVPSAAKIANATGFIAQTFITPQAGDIFRLQVVGSVITVYQNGALILTAVDSTVTTGKPGIFASPLNGAAADVAWDNWSAGSLSGLDFIGTGKITTVSGKGRID